MYSQNEYVFVDVLYLTIPSSCNCICIAIRCLYKSLPIDTEWIYPNSFLEKGSQTCPKSCTAETKKERSALSLLVGKRPRSHPLGQRPSLHLWQHDMALLHSLLHFYPGNAVQQLLTIPPAWSSTSMLICKPFFKSGQLWGGKTWTSESTLGFTGWEPGRSSRGSKENQWTERMFPLLRLQHVLLYNKRSVFKACLRTLHPATARGVQT